MKTLSIAGICFVIFACACTKTNDAPGEQQLASSQSEDLSQIKLANILTSHPWMYQEFYSHYIDEQHKGQRFYDRDSTDNFDEYLADVIFKFHKDHRFSKFVSPYTYKGTWKFSDNKPTFITLNFSYGTETDSIVLFNAGHLNYFKKENYSHWYTALVPAK